MTSSLEQFGTPHPPDERTGSGSPFVWPTGPETVVNPERRGLLSSLDPSPTPRSGLWQRLFPSDSELSERGPADVSGIDLDHFTLEDRIGVGGMGTVFLATDRRLRRSVALKVLAPAFVRDPAAVQRFQNEARAAARLDHDNIARVYYYGEDQGLHFIAYEYVTGTNIRDLIRQRGRLEPADAVNYTLQIAAALNHTAAAGVVHRDIKPSNIIITPAGRAKLVDLGLARKESLDESADLTMAGTTLGTFDYISPEQARDPRNVDVRSDIYSLGCTLYHMLAGEPPYPEGTVLQKLLDHQGNDPPDPARKNRRVPPPLSAIVRKMMASDPNRRYPSPDELIRDLLTVARSMGLRGAHPDSVVWIAPQLHRPHFWQRNVGWLVAAAALLLIVVVLDRFPNLITTPQTTGLPVADPGAITTASGTRKSSPPPSPSEPVGSEQTGVSDATASLTASAPLDSSPQPAVPNIGEGASLFTEWAARWLFGPPPAASPELASTNGSKTPLLRDPEQVFDESASPIAPQKLPLPTSISTVPGTSIATESRPRTAPSESPPLIATPPSAAELQPFSVGEKFYQTLEAACAAAADGGVIELRYNGRRREAEKPFVIDHKSLVIRAAKGFRPTVTFGSTTTAVEEDAPLIAVVGGSLNLFNVDLELNVPENGPTERWVLFGLQRAGDVRLKGVNLTIHNPGRQPTAIVELTAAPGASLSTMGMMNGGQPRDPVQFEVSESLIRGGAQLFVARDGEPAQILIEQSVLALSGAVLNVAGAMDVPENGSLINFVLKHVTCLTGGNLVRIDSSEDLAGEAPHVHVEARSNVFALDAEMPLVEAIRHNDDLENLRDLLTWTSERNYYDETATFLSVISRANMTAVKPLGYEEWRRFWGSSIEGSRNQPILWKEDWQDLDYAAITKAAVQLDDLSPNNPAVAGASDGTDAGVDPQRLPPDPLPPTP